ncbi:hypothetical protein [Alkalimarinus coralli]|uniref:hypothetical protein n=1 Tax=Alkalimarinus coralli TaxID=2935863 RepID=UPI00202B7221|nr:hypothetical protein [Alkalimarinus coralli]
MIRYCILGLLLFTLSACVNTSPITIKPTLGIEFAVPVETIDLIEMAENELLLYRKQQLVGSMQRVPAPEPGKTAIESLKEGFKEAQKGTNKPSILSLPVGSYGFVVNTIDFSTAFIATQNDTRNWVVVSIKKDQYDMLIESLKLKARTSVKRPSQNPISLWGD